MLLLTPIDVNAIADQRCVVLTVASGTIRTDGIPVGEVILAPKTYDNVSDCNVEAKATLDLITEDKSGKLWGVVQSYFIQCLKTQECSLTSDVEPRYW